MPSKELVEKIKKKIKEDKRTYLQNCILFRLEPGL